MRNALAHFVHNQSPWMGWFCGDVGDEQADAPDEDCFSTWLRMGPRTQLHPEISEQYDPGAPNDELDILMEAAVAKYGVDALEGEDLQSFLSVVAWDSPDEGKGADILMSADPQPLISYTVVHNPWDSGAWVVFSSSENGEGSEMPCYLHDPR